MKKQLTAKKEINPSMIVKSILKAIDEENLTNALPANEASRFVDDLGVDSLDCVDIIMHVERDLKISIQDEDIEQMRILSIKQFADLVYEHL